MCHSFGGGLCVVFLSPLFLLSRASFFAHVAPAATNRESFFVYLLCFSRFFFILPFTSVQRSSFVYVVLSLTRRSPSLRSLCGRCSRSINFRWFVFCTCCVCVFVCENVLVCVWAMNFFVYTIFFVGRRAATLTSALASCFLGPPVEWFFSYFIVVVVTCVVRLFVCVCVLLDATFIAYDINFL